MESEFPSNSRAAKRPTPAEKQVEEKKIRKVVTGTVVQRKKPLGRKFREFFFSGPDNHSIFYFVLHEVVIPESKGIFMEIVNVGLDRKLYPDGKPAGSRYGRNGRSGGGYTPYNRMGKPSSVTHYRRDPMEGPGRDDHSAARPSPRRQSRDIGEIVLDTRPEATEVLDQMFEILSKYDVISVSDLMGMLGEEPSPLDGDWGWADLRGSDVQRVSDGYLLILPKPIYLD